MKDVMSMIEDAQADIRMAGHLFGVAGRANDNDSPALALEFFEDAEAALKCGREKLYLVGSLVICGNLAEAVAEQARQEAAADVPPLAVPLELFAAAVS